MVRYTNEASFAASWSDKEVESLLSGKDGVANDNRFGKACDAAAGVIDGYLTRGSYELELKATLYGEEVAAAPLDYPYLFGPIQECSDCFVAYFLAKSADKQKKVYEDCFKSWTKYLEDVGKGVIILPYTRLDPSGPFAVVARPQVFTRYHLNDYFPYRDRY